MYDKKVTSKLLQTIAITLSTRNAADDDEKWYTEEKLEFLLGRLAEEIADQPHDFGWALRQMRAGLCVKCGDMQRVYRIMSGDHLMIWVRTSWEYHSDIHAKLLLATDWAVCADPEGE